VYLIGAFCFPLQTVKAFLPWMLENNYGYIINIASVLAFAGFPKLADYSASKAAVLSFSESLRLELKELNKTGVSVTCVCPYHMDTTMIRGVTSNFPSVFRALKVEYVAERILQALRDRQFVVVIPRSFYTQVVLKG
jgi:all-trans-retinol dehydrogenase (NAD+)